MTDDPFFLFQSAPGLEMAYSYFPAQPQIGTGSTGA